MSQEITEQMYHLQEVIHRLDVQQSDSNSEVTKQYGYIKFYEDELDSTTRLSQYIRLALQTNAKTIFEFIQDAWRLSTPDLIISVTGGGKQCNMSAHLQKIFQRGLIAAAATTNAWLITAGTNAGVAKQVGEALNNYRYKSRNHGLDVPCIGICSWEYTAGTEQLDNGPYESPKSNRDNINKTTELLKSSRRLRTDSIQLDVPSERHIRTYVVKQPDAKRFALEPNHTHFLLLDGMTKDNDKVLMQRAEIEAYCRGNSLNTSMTSPLIPIVMILVEGGPFSVRTVCHALQSNTPLVVFKGSGRAADLVADLHIFFSQEETDQSKEAELNSIFEKSRSNNNGWVDGVRHDLCQVLNQQKQLVVIFEFDSPRHHGKIDDAILEALINAAKFSGDNTDEQKCRVAELKLTLAWQKFDYAHKHLLSDATISKWTEADLCQALIDALCRSYVNFVELLMDYGTSLGKLTWNDLEKLYTSADTDCGLPLEENNNENGRTRYNYFSQYFPEQFAPHRISMDKTLLMGQNAAREVFLWAIFLDRFELAKYLCSKTWNQSVAPLMGAQIYRLASNRVLHSEAKQLYEHNASEFDTYAMSIIDRCFENDENLAVNLLKQPAIAFDNVEALVLAEQAHCRSFLASKCVQRHLVHQWYGHINFKRPAIHLKIFLCSLFLPLLPIFSVFLPYVQEYQQIVRSNKNASSNANSVIIQTVIISDRDAKSNRLRWSKKVFYFYQAPIVRFFYNVMFFVIFLGLFSYVLLIEFLPLKIVRESHSNIKHLSLPVTEVILHVCVWSLILEEFRQFYLTRRQEYFSDMWNWMDISAILLYLIAFITRFIVTETFFMISKICLCLDLIIWFIGTLHLFAAFERLGPKLVMIFNTMKDLFFFVCFIIIFLCAFSITSWSLITSASQLHWIYGDDGQLMNVTVSVAGNKTWTWKLVRDITQYGVWKVFGQVDPIDGTDTYSHVAFILAIIFVAIANILLLNVLIALFNVTIQNVQEHSHNLWRYQRYLIVNEYTRKTPLPPPFNTIYYLFLGIRFLIRGISRYRNRRRFVANETLLDEVRTDNDKNLPPSFKISDSMRWENAIAEDYWRAELKETKPDQMEDILHNIEQKIGRLTSRSQDNNKRISDDHQLKKQKNVESDV